MAGRVAPYVDNTGLVFAYDQSNIIRSYLGKPAINFYTNGDFTGGTGVTQEGGSNATNTVVQLENPGNSPYVLRQNGNYTEYQINLTSQLSSSTTYVMSGWYAESPEYNGNSMMFHSRAFSASGNHVALDVGLYNVVTTKVVGGLTWKYCYATITTPSDYNNDFNWYLGYGQPSHTGYRYYTNLQMEVGSTPSQFVDGTRSVTQGLKDLTGKSTIDLSNVSFDSNAQMTFDGTNDSLVVGNNSTLKNNNTSIEFIIKYLNTPNGDIIQFGVGSGTYAQYYYRAYSGYSFWNWYPVGTGYGEIAIPNAALPLNKFHHIVMTGTPEGYVQFYINGIIQSGATRTANSQPATWTPADLTVGGFSWDGYSNSEIPYVKIYNRVLSASEIQQNFNAVRGRYGI
jgi:hypothetical protein